MFIYTILDLKRSYLTTILCDSVDMCKEKCVFFDEDICIFENDNYITKRIGEIWKR